MSSSYQSLVDDEEKNQIGIDFDGVIHANSMGYHDGTIYDDPVPGTKEALSKLSLKYNIVVFTCKAKPDRVLVNGKTGTELVWEWLEKHKLARFVKSVTSEKPRAAFYIDDKAFRFKAWEFLMPQLERL